MASCRVFGILLEHLLSQRGLQALAEEEDLVCRRHVRDRSQLLLEDVRVGRRRARLLEGGDAVTSDGRRLHRTETRVQTIDELGPVDDLLLARLVLPPVHGGALEVHHREADARRIIREGRRAVEHEVLREAAQPVVDAEADGSAERRNRRHLDVCRARSARLQLGLQLGDQRMTLGIGRLERGDALHRLLRRDGERRWHRRRGDGRQLRRMLRRLLRRSLSHDGRTDGRTDGGGLGRS